MKLEEKMFIRTKTGYICKLININDFREPSMKYGVEASYLKDIMFIGDDDILKASHNIIDLIEVGDYVNGRKVHQVGYNFQDDLVLKMSDSNYDDFIYPNEIKTIVTKEMYENMQYEVK